MSILVHVSDRKVDVLEPCSPSPGDRPCICFSEDCFVSYFGQWIYLFDRDVLIRDFGAVWVPSGGIWQNMTTDEQRMATHQKSYGPPRLCDFEGQELKWEYRVQVSVPANKGIGVIENFNYTKGMFTEWFVDMAHNKLGPGTTSPVQMDERPRKTG